MPFQPVRGARAAKPAPRRVKWVATAAAVVLSAGGAVVATTAAATSAAAATGCAVDYDIVNSWGSGFQADVTINNVGDPISGWELAWDFAGNETIGQAWNAGVTQSGRSVTAADVGWNGTLGTGASTSFGFTVNGAPGAAPSSFTMNGVACTGDTVPTPDPTTTEPDPDPTTTGPSPTSRCDSGSSVVSGSSGNYTVTNDGRNVYQGGDYRAAIQAGIDNLDSGRSSQQHVAVPASGSIGASTIDLPSHTSISICGTMNVGNRGGRGAIEATDVSDVTIWHANMTGNPYFGMRFYGVNGLHLGDIDLRFNGGMGIRFERDYAASRNVVIDDVYVEGTNNHGVETWNVDGLEVGTVVARNVAGTGLLLNNTVNANIGTVDGDDVATGTGYATFRTANRAGRMSDGSYPTNIVVDRVISRGGGRGVFCVSESGGVQIRNIDLAYNGNNAVLIENCYNYRIDGGTVNGGGEVRVAARSEFANTRDVTVTARVDNTSVRESPCGVNITWNITGNASRNVC
ncbi:cellulose binding domain-containing protein [Myceligenerans xiligouense]|uniref:Cellulose binding domain-containing protein n=1 Tax=Myceligenerans xiligouense TaxID=253184 RepID=A0A3N4ZTI7_9MICO|nr:cellulose binding domain-containing protein [Myceligenerans xiligouense]